MDSSKSTSETSENVYLFVFISPFVSLGVFIYVCSGKLNFQQKISTRVNKKRNKSSSKEYATRARFKF